MPNPTETDLGLPWRLRPETEYSSEALVDTNNCARLFIDNGNRASITHILRAANNHHAILGALKGCQPVLEKFLECFYADRQELLDKHFAPSSMLESEISKLEKQLATIDAAIAAAEKE